jgi:hypothetical protein
MEPFIFTIPQMIIIARMLEGLVIVSVPIALFSYGYKSIEEDDFQVDSKKIIKLGLVILVGVALLKELITWSNAVILECS